MTGTRAFARAADGTEEDITEGVQALYDLVISSMDFRSGFWTAEDAVPVAQLARLLGFERAEEIERYLAEQLHSTEQAAFWQEHPQAWAYRGTPQEVPHDHVLSSAGRCMWRGCRAKGEPEPHHVGGFPSE